MRYMNPIRNIKRLNKIISTLVRYGFGGLVQELQLHPYFSFLRKIWFLRRSGGGMSVPERIRLVLEELGPTFVKLGQVASTRTDLLPLEWISELKKLQDMVPPISAEKARKVVERSLKGTLEEKFKSFDAEPMASASIAQVHNAVLPDGTLVAVKVKRPDIEKTIDADISVMYTLAKLLVKHIPEARRLKPVEVVDEFARTIHNEIDLTIEGSHATRFYRIYKDDPTVQIPKVYWDFTTPDVLTLERVSGTPVDELETIKAKGLNAKTIAENGLNAFFTQVFDHGIFHADLHPGNIFARDDGAIIFLDFGIVGTLDKKLRHYLATMLFYILRQDYRRMALLHKQIGLIGSDVDIDEFENALRDMAEPIFGRELNDINISHLMMKLIQTARRFDMELQPNLLLLQRSMVIIEGVGRQLYPDANMWEIAKPVIYRWVIKEKLSPKGHIDNSREYVEELAHNLSELPGQVNTVLNRYLNDEL
ncbi:MAG: 2-polyprenylphenol 6-hydroxylase, partial [Deltaproteobacteria bacterium]|nr:2-polyprenylphenol 6-hydroxylase [Deltaproteobacteria bacterium]